MADNEFNFGPATAIVVKWTAADEDRYADDYDKARELGGIVVDWMEATGEISQRAFVRGMGYDDKKYAGVVTKVRRSFVV
ncbi:MAG TPA: hypothetical protein VNC22_07710, partial [Sporichthya sp.]|nr:hypothetical protein [Sporichthya sp.]